MNKIPQGFEELYLKKKIARKDMDFFFRFFVKQLVEKDVRRFPEKNIPQI